jgi:hypothetical protein
MSFDRFSVSHGKPVKGFSVDFAELRSTTDFGRGFYLTSCLEQAEDWANQLAFRRRRAKKTRQDKSLVLRFEIDRDDLAKLDYLVFLLPNSDFKRFIGHCRQGSDNHCRNSTDNFFDVVFGPLTLYPQ